MNFNKDPQAHLTKVNYIKNRMAVRHNNQSNNNIQAEYDKHINNINWRQEPTLITNRLANGAIDQVENDEGGDDNLQIG